MFREFTQARTYFRRRPSLAIAVVCTLAAGVGLTTAVFSIVDAVLLRPLPWQAAHELVRVYGTNPERQDQRTWNRQMLRWQEVQALTQVQGFGQMGAWVDSPFPMVLGPERNTLVRGLKVSSGFLPALRIVPSQGRGFSATDDTEVTGTVIVTHEAWQSRFGGRPDILGLEIHVGTAWAPVAQQRRQVVGVLPPGFRLPLTRYTQLLDEPPALLLPIEFANEKSSPGYEVLARLEAGASIDAASAAASSIVAGVGAQFGSPSARVVGLAESAPGLPLPLWLLFGGAGLLLLVASSNVAGMLLTQASARQQEMATRRALGAGGAVIFRQLVVEHLILGLAAAAAGLLLAWQLIPLLVALAPPQLQGVEAAAISVRVAAFAVVVATATSVIFGTFPTLALLRVSPARALSQGGRSATAAHRRWHRLVISAEVALTVVLLVVAGLFAETIVRLNGQPLGIEPSGLAVVSTLSTASDTASHWPSVEAAVSALEAVPGVRSVAASSALPFLGEPVNVGFRLAGGTEERRAEQAVVTPRYFETMGMPVVRGRGFSGAGRGSGDAVVSSSFERLFFNGNGPGRTLSMSDGRQLLVVGIVPDVKRHHLAEDERPTLYALDGPTGGVMQFAVRTDHDTSALMLQLRDAVTRAGNLGVTASTSMEAVLSRSMAAQRFRALLGSVFASSALVLVAIGLYGLTARMVVDRGRELSLRLALGADPASIRRLVLRDGLTTAAVGCAVGLPAAVMATSFARSLLFGVDALALHTYGLTLLVLAVTGFLATWIPANAASRTTPGAVLRGE